ncbi:hypothetical protein Ddye_031223 [Dipteronia dyeriana]|uniref:DUF659 domain-containing protein n=1 Tax=Dipteronia dyeriana TaxID=168575 RepID=A0AAD9TI53_9ROSI|nr:hypothetical protein Ddye_031223 [Dipteronia dyeriana]
MVTTKLLKEKMSSSCVTHTTNLILESIGKLPKYKKFIDSTKAFIIFVYTHHKTLSLMMNFTKRRDIMRSGVIRFASTFLSLESLVDKKDRSRQMFISAEWEKCKWVNTVKGKDAYSTTMSLGFRNDVNLCMQGDEEVESNLETDDDMDEEIEVQFESDEERADILGGGNKD